MAKESTSSDVNDLDLNDYRNEYLFPMPTVLEQYFLGQIKNPVNMVMLYLMFDICVTSIPWAITMFLMESPPLLMGIAYIAFNFAIFMERFILTLHYQSHSPIFPRGDVRNSFASYILAPLFGMPSGMYYFHHVVMHHRENNIFPYDVSSTMTYQRNSFTHFLHYWARYTFAIWFQLPFYLVKRKNYNLFAKALVALVGYFVLIRLLWAFNAAATVYVFIAPFFLASGALMFGNWSQHIFVDPKRFNDSYALTYNIVNSSFNKRTYNDGYHIVHHVKPALHWSKLPTYFKENMDKFAEEGSFTFHTVDFMAVGFYCMTGQLEKLADYYVNIGPKKYHRSKQEVIAEMKSRFVPVPVPTEEVASKNH
eukprot:TRINITY_DN5615_c0_g1_i1.p1 TRINITY_DN5615_c0_g1~~TRINITY_DN5615_c0_g1_i1.p1  ORF type:complete len:366 (+),score=63.98 TRINITY_DN5615_c0_g1_i1:49-1146(+)